MTRRVDFSPEAEAEVLEVREWHDSRRPGLGGEFATALENSIARIIDNPFVFPKVRRNTRRAVLHRFPYAVYFQALDDAIVVAAIHGRQHPLRWQSRS